MAIQCLPVPKPVPLIILKLAVLALQSETLRYHRLSSSSTTCGVVTVTLSWTQSLSWWYLLEQVLRFVTTGHCCHRCGGHCCCFLYLSVVLSIVAVLHCKWHHRLQVEAGLEVHQSRSRVVVVVVVVKVVMVAGHSIMTL